MADQKMCDECGIRPAVYYETNIINGVMTERYLCEECKKKHGTIKPNLSDRFDTFVTVLPTPFGSYKSAQRVETKVCPKWGCTTESYLKTGFRGCS